MVTVESSDPRTIEEWLGAVAPMLGLSDWTFRVEWHELPLEQLARVDAAYARRTAAITLGEAYVRSSRESQRETLVHELVHLHLTPLDEFVDDTLPTMIGKACYTIFEAAYDVFEERAIDALSVAIADMGTIPFPPEEG